MNLWEKITKKMPPAACGHSGHLGGLTTPWSDVTFQILRTSNNQSYTPTPIFSEIEERRRKKERKKERILFFLDL